MVDVKALEQRRGQMVQRETTNIVKNSMVDSEAQIFDGQNLDIITMYNTRTGDSVRVCDTETNVNIIIAKKFSDGSPVYTYDQSACPEVVMGTFKCLLHPDRDFTGMGFQACSKSTLIDEWQVELHMKSKHKREWASIEKIRNTTKEEAREAKQDRLMEFAVGAKATTPKPEVGTSEAPLYVKDSDKEK